MYLVYACCSWAVIVSIIWVDFDLGCTFTWHYTFAVVIRFDWLKRVVFSPVSVIYIDSRRYDGSRGCVIGVFIDIVYHCCIGWATSSSEDL